MSSLSNFFSEIVNGPDYNKITRESRGLVESMPALLEGRIGEIESAYGSAIETSRANVTSDIASGLKARGISGEGVAKASGENISSGLSGAYAAAHSALNQAKVNARLKMGGAMSTYYQELADKQYKAMMGAYAARMGLVGALGGAVGSQFESGSWFNGDKDAVSSRPGTKALQVSKSKTITDKVKAQEVGNNAFEDLRGE